ncbi:MAG TPA: hypothetical protein VNG32_05450 [Candidatus Dormibacteraeota bacterium]|nr:hypothetical protein [Candidatus Dormibacteraeota bacterium]
MRDIFFNILGIIGSLLILFGFYRISIGRWSGKSILYELDNLLGGVLLIIYQVHFRAYITVFLNVIWVVVAFKGVVSITERRKPARRPKA